jgi:hypothetical protein
MALAGPALAAGPPTVTNIIPVNGAIGGGTSVTIFGTNLSGATAVKFGTHNAASFTVNSSTQITAVSPPGVEGTNVNVAVTTPEGTDETQTFHYRISCEEGPPPRLLSVEPHSGIAETRVTIKGEFLPAVGCFGGLSVDRVFFGFTHQATIVEVPQPKAEVVVLSPPGAGTSDVRVENVLGVTPVTESDQFTTVLPIYHWYRGGVILPEGVSAPVVIFGGKVNLSQNSAVGEINCRTVAGGIVENPTGGGAGSGKSNSASFYECKAPQCEEEVLKATGLEGRGTVTTQNDPGATKEPAFPGWSNVLEESVVAGVNSVREKIGEPFETFKTPSPPGMIRETVICEVAVNQSPVETAIGEGELKPEIGLAKSGNLNGNQAGKPSTIKFSGASTGALGGQDTFSGSLKYLGYNEQELITVKP